LHAHREVAPLNVRVQIWPGHPAARARLDSIDGRFIKFSVEAHDGVAQIGTGTHVRALVDLSRFDKKLDATYAVPRILLEWVATGWRGRPALRKPPCLLSRPE
jgi:hypothetical protein